MLGLATRWQSSECPRSFSPVNIRKLLVASGEALCWESNELARDSSFYIVHASGENHREPGLHAVARPLDRFNEPKLARFVTSPDQP